MSTYVEDLSGRKFGMLSVVKFAGCVGKNSKWECLCECGNKRVAYGFKLKNGSALNCGTKVHGRAKRERSKPTHRTRLYVIWSNMKRRCNVKVCKSYKHYGARGIKYSAEWEKFQPFKDWAMSNGYTDDLELDRIDVNGNYEPSNCRWVTKKQNINNRRNTVIIEINGVKQPLTTWCEIYNVPRQRVYSRLRLGWSATDAIITPIMKKQTKAMG